MKLTKRVVQMAKNFDDSTGGSRRESHQFAINLYCAQNPLPGTAGSMRVIAKRVGRRDREEAALGGRGHASCGCLGRFLILWSKLDNLPAVLERNPLPSFSEVVRYVELDYFCHVIPAFSTSSGLLLPLDITRLRWSLLLVEANLVSGVGEISPLHSCGEHIGRRIRSQRQAEVPVRSDSGSSESLFVWCSATQNKGSRSPIKRT